MGSDITQFQAILNRVGAEKDEVIQIATKWAVDQSLLALRQQEEIERLRAELAAAKRRIEELEAPIRNPLSSALQLEEALRHEKKEGGGA